MKKPVFYKEVSYLLGIVILALGASLLVQANFGVSVVVAPAYILHLKLSQTWSYITFGVAEYMVQGFLLLLLIVLVRRFHWSYLFAFITALFYGLVLDLILLALSFFTFDLLPLRIAVFLLGMLLCTLGVALVFRTYIAPEVYELILKELSAKHHWQLSHLKTAYDCASCLIAILLSFAFFGLFQFRGIGIGTVVCALLNGKLVGIIGRFLDRRFTFQSAYPKMEHYFSPPPFPEEIPEA